MDLGSEIRDPVFRVKKGTGSRIGSATMIMTHLLPLKVQEKVPSFEDCRYLEACVHVSGEESLEVGGEVGEAALQRTEGGVPGRGTLVQRRQQQLTPLSITDQALRSFYLLARLAKKNNESTSTGISSLHPSASRIMPSARSISSLGSLNKQGSLGSAANTDQHHGSGPPRVLSPRSAH